MVHDPFHVGKRKPLTDKQRAKLFVEHQGRCCVCHNKIQAGQRWIDEHVKPLWLAGTDEDFNAWANRGPAHEDCAKVKTAREAKERSKGRRVAQKHMGAKRSKNPLPGSRASKWKRKMDGSVVRRDQE
jgi:5-methylcytosine-specific restriction endonuclease McrA